MISAWAVFHIIFFVLLAAGLYAAGAVHHNMVIKKRRAAERSQRRHGKTEIERLTTLINAIGDAIFYTNNSGKILLYNSSALGLIDTNVSVRGRLIDTVLPLRTDTGKLVKPSSLVNPGGGVGRNDLLYSYDEETADRINIDLLITPMRSTYQERGRAGGGSKNLGYIYIVRDITKAKTLEEERDEFISVVSHELRTPVAVTEGTVSNAQLMIERGLPMPKIKSAVDEAHKQVVYLANMVNDLSTLSRAERGVYDTPEDINVEDLAHTLYNEYAPQATAKGLRLDLDLKPDPGILFVSRLYLEEVLQNFITNAIKYTQKGTVTVGVSRDGDYVTFSVKDSGIGISTSDQKRIFQKFYRSEDYRTRETNGTGLGLYVVSKLVAKLNAKIDVKSRLNHGSAFSLTLRNSRGSAKS